MINIYGKGGHARMLASILKNKGEYYHLYDDTDFKNAQHKRWLIGIGENKTREIIVNRLTEHYFNIFFVSINHSVYSSDDLKTSEGVVILPGSVIQNNVHINEHAIINTSASIDHDCFIGKYCHIAPNSTLCGGIHIGDYTLIGAGSVILPGIKIGKKLYNRCW